VLNEPGRFEMTSVTPAPVLDGEARVEIEGCGVCGSNVPVWEGRPWFSYPLPPGAPGHEAWGVVTAVGEGVDAGVCRTGDRVAVLSEHAFSEAVNVPASKVVVLPDALSSAPFPGEAIGSAINVARRCGFDSDKTVAVVGVGFLGALVVALAVRCGARVIAVSRRPYSLEIAAVMGASELVCLDGKDVEQKVNDLTGGELCDVAVEAVGLQGSLDLAGRLTKVRGRMVIAGYHQDGPRSADVQLWNWRGIDIVNAHERDDRTRLDGIREAARLVADGDLDPSPLYTHEFPLERVGDALDAVTGRPPGFLKALVRR
jgi:threonine dehydrogenase-like Zn-dependent dehydrogenase